MPEVSNFLEKGSTEDEKAFEKTFWWNLKVKNSWRMKKIRFNKKFVELFFENQLWKWNCLPYLKNFNEFSL